MSTQAQFWSDSWETSPSNARKPIWGNSNGVHETPRPARDQSIPLPPIPAADLSYRSEWAAQNSGRLQLTGGFLAENDELLGLLNDNLPRSESEFLQPGSLSLDRAPLSSESGNAAEHSAHGRLAAVGR